MKRYEFMIRGAITALAGLAALAMCMAASAQSVIVNSAPGVSAFTSVCTSVPALSMDPAGNLVITCPPTTTGGGLQAPVCSVLAPGIQAGASAMATVSASCTGGAVATYAWTNTNSAPGFPSPSPTTASFSVGPFPTAGSFSFGLTATNATGSSNPSGTLIVSTTTTGGGGSCPTVALAGGQSTFTDTYGIATLSIPRGGIASIALPPWAPAAANHAYYTFSSAQVTSTQNDLGTQISISTCPGDFTANPAPCRAWGVANTGSTTIQGNAGAGPSQYCYMAATVVPTQYYLNIHNVLQDGVTPSCNTASCGIIIQMHTGYY